MATRKVLQEIPILPPQTEQQSFVVVTEEAIPDPCTQHFSFPAKAHAKYSSNDEAKENITPAEFENINGETYKYEKSDVEKKADPTELNNQESSSGLNSDFSLQQKDDRTFGMTEGAESIVTPMKDIEFSDWRIGESNTPVDFSKATVDDFGISSEKFTNSGGKSPRSLHKHRRRSTIGVRGSPETNFLIRQIALQRSKRQHNPEPLTNPFISPRNSVLKEKMSSFQNAFQAVEENEGKLQFSGFSEEEEEEEETQSDTVKSEGNGNTSGLSEPPGKRKRVYDTSLPMITSVPVKPHAPLLSTQPQETTQEMKQVPVLEKISESAGSPASMLLTAVSKSDVQIEETQPVPSSTRGQKRKVMFADLPSSPKSKKTLCINEAHKSDCHSFSSPVVLRPVLKKTSRKEFSSFIDELGDPRVCFLVPEPLENENTLFKKTVNDSVKKRVTFGRELSPELFDKTLPANTPLRKGSTPYRQHASDTATPTTQEAVYQSPCQSLAQPDFDCTDEEDTFKPLSLCFDSGSPSKDSTMLMSSPVKDDQVLPTEELEDVTEEHNHIEEDEKLLISYDFPENSAAPALDTEIANASFIVFEPDTVPAKSKATRFSNRSKVCSSEDPPRSDNTQTADTSKVQVTTSAKPSSKRSRKHVVIIKKVQVKAPQVKGKKSRGRPKKSVQKSLYGKRETVSKKPLLSPIAEVPEYHPAPPASTLVSLGGTLNKGFLKSISKRRGIQKDRGKVQKRNVPSEVLNSSDPIVLKIEDGSCPEQGGLEVKQTESLTDGQSHTEPADLVLQVETLSSSTECPLSTADMEVKQDDLPEPSESLTVPEDRGTTETMTAPKLQNKSKRRSTTQRRLSQTTTEMPHIANTDLLENLMNADHNTTETRAEDQKPEIDVLVENRAHSPKLPLITGIAGGKKGRRSSRNFSKSAIFSQSAEPNIHTQDPSTMLPHPDENSIAFTNEPYLPIDEILQDAGTKKKVRRSMRLRRDSGASGLFWVQENTSSEGTNRRKSLSSAVQPLGNSNSILKSGSCSPNKEQITVKQVPRAANRKSLSSAVQSLEGSNLILESVTHSPKKEQLSVHQVPSAVKKTRRRTLCTSTLQQMASLGDAKSRRSNVSYKDSLSDETHTSHNNITLGT